ncbi:MAG: MOSC domain-containing protein [Bacteroidota bacterium]|nr:MOSC domain-containing protein [Odoribacter sp.]MDP3644806.1 MOSC domain-containing protein [Bacteroidota bacterium]
MQIISTNIAQPLTIEWRGQQIQTGIYKYGVETPIFLGKEDVENDHVLDRRYHGGEDKACYLYSADHYPFWKTKYPDLDWQWGMFGENLTVRGLDESEIYIGDTYQFGEAVIQVSQPRQPCFKLGFRFGNQKVVDDFWSLPYPGFYVRVLQPGKVQKGNEFVLLDRDTDCLSVSQVFSIFRSIPTDRKLIQKAIENQFLAESCRRDIQKILDKR